MKTMTQIEAARQGILTEAVKQVAQQEWMSAEDIRARVAAGAVVIPANPAHANLRPIGIGRDLRTKINANLGSSPQAGNAGSELEKLNLAVQLGSDTVMDLSTSPDLDEIRSSLLAHCSVPLGTVPIYQALAQIADPMDLTVDLLLEVILSQAQQGVDFMTVHAGLLRDQIPDSQKRLTGIVSRGGSILAQWMSRHKTENPLYVHFDRVLDICRAHDVTLSLGDGMRPGCLADASDAAQFAELRVLAGLVRRCRAAGVQVMVEGPGHIPLDQIEMNMKIEDDLCDHAPFYILGPVVTDCAPGYDHIAAAIGAALGAYHGAAMLCYVTPKEHLGLPNLDDVRAGVVAFKIAAHAADVALHRPHARDRDDATAKARFAFDWNTQFENALDPEYARVLRQQSLCEAHLPETDGPCTMCGPKFCSMRINREIAPT